MPHSTDYFFPGCHPDPAVAGEGSLSFTGFVTERCFEKNDSDSEEPLSFANRQGQRLRRCGLLAGIGHFHREVGRAGLCRETGDHDDCAIRWVQQTEFGLLFD